MRTALNTCLLVLLFVLTGCGSIASRWRGERGPYVGVRFDADCLADTQIGEMLLAPVALADIPLSAILDTFYLPYDLTGEKQEVRNEPPPSEPLPNPAATGRTGYVR